MLRGIGKLKTVLDNNFINKKLPDVMEENYHPNSTLVSIRCDHVTTQYNNLFACCYFFAGQNEVKMSRCCQSWLCFNLIRGHR